MFNIEFFYFALEHERLEDLNEISREFHITGP